MYSKHTEVKIALKSLAAIRTGKVDVNILISSGHICQLCKQEA